jgi:hypothetical protein
MSRSRTGWLFVAAAALALLAGACGTTLNTPSADSGIEGLVTIGPMCPVEIEGQPCPDQPYEAPIVVEDAGGDEVARVTSDADGRFRVTLEPGAYTLVPQSPESRLPYAGEQSTEVVAGEYTQVTIAYDSGIR